MHAAHVHSHNLNSRSKSLSMLCRSPYADWHNEDNVGYLQIYTWWRCIYKGAFLFLIRLWTLLPFQIR